jgi:hypothetical protein
MITVLQVFLDRCPYGQVFVSGTMLNHKEKNIYSIIYFYACIYYLFLYK